MKKLKVLLKCIPLFLLFIFVGCGSSGGDLRPPELMLGSDTCEECGMLVSDAKYAAATLTEDGHSHKFDDLAEMFVFQAKHADETVQAWFVHDYDTEIWIRGEQAFYVQSPQIQSPMNYGVVAFEIYDVAQAFAKQVGGQVFTFEEFRSEIAMNQ